MACRCSDRCYGKFVLQLSRYVFNMSCCYVVVVWAAVCWCSAAARSTPCQECTGSNGLQARASCSQHSPSPVDAFAGLLDAVHAEQWKHSQTYNPPDTFPPLQFEHICGLYSSYLHFNTHGPAVASRFRHSAAVPDSNAFVTLAVLHNQLEAVQLCTIYNHSLTLQHFDKASMGTGFRHSHLGSSTGTTHGTQAAQGTKFNRSSHEMPGLPVVFPANGYAVGFCDAVDKSITDERIKSAIDGVSSMHDPRDDHAVPLYGFWPWRWVDTTSGQERIYAQW